MGFKQCLHEPCWLLRNKHMSIRLSIRCTNIQVALIEKHGIIGQDIRRDDFINLPTGSARNTQKYTCVKKNLVNSSENTRLVGHSLASAVVDLFATPTIKPQRHGKKGGLIFKPSICSQ